MRPERLLYILLENKIDDAIRYVQGVMSKLHRGEVDLKDLVLSKKLLQPPHIIIL